MKKDRFAYLRWRIFNKILIKTWMLINWVLWWSNLLWEIELYWDGGWLFVAKTKCTRKKEKWGRGKGGLIVRSQIKYYWWNDWQNYSISNSISHSVSKNIMSSYDLSFFESHHNHCKISQFYRRTNSVGVW
jgi:hypothetical protein